MISKSKRNGTHCKRGRETKIYVRSQPARGEKLYPETKCDPKNTEIHVFMLIRRCHEGTLTCKGSVMKRTRPGGGDHREERV